MYIIFQIQIIGVSLLRYLYVIVFGVLTHLTEQTHKEINIAVFQQPAY